MTLCSVSQQRTSQIGALQLYLLLLPSQENTPRSFLYTPFYHNFPASVYYYFINTAHNFTERNISTTGRKKFAELGILPFMGGLALCSLNKSFFCLICNILYRTKLFRTDFSLHILFIALYCVEPSSCLTQCKVSNLSRILLNLLLIC